MIVLIAFAVGCRRHVATPPTRQPAINPSSESATNASTSHPPTAGEHAAGTAASELPPEEAAPIEELATASDTSTNEVLTDDPSSESTADIVEVGQPPSERFLLLTRDGPLVIDVILRIDDQPYTNALEQLVERVSKELEQEATSGTTWGQMIDHPKFAYGQFGNLAPEDADQKKQLSEMYDTNRNGLVDRDELPRFLTRNAGGSRPFSLRSSNEFRGDNRTRSLVRRLLDTDHNGAITAEEVQAAPLRLFERDADDNEILVLADFKDSVEQVQPGMSNQRRINAPDTAILIGERTRWGYVSYALQETYAYGERVGAGDVPLTPELVELLDKNNNALIDRSEVPELANVAPHLVLEVAFFNPNDASRPTTPRIKIISACESLSAALVVARQHPTRLSFELPGSAVDFFVNEAPSLSNASQTINAQFSMLDADNNGYLDADEYAGQILGFNIPFEALDADGDGVVMVQEVAALLEQRQAVVRAQIRARAADQEDALFAALDTNGDGRLTARETYGAPKVLKDLDRNHDGELQSHEIPGTMAVGFVRGNAQRDNALLVMPAVSQRSDRSELPDWFAGMDANGDGDISPREFLGSRDKFDQLDTNGDGFVSEDEATRFDPA
ncbi:MAG: EF-hand domain-containing protein [Pirellulaceae bacterium]